MLAIRKGLQDERGFTLVEVTIILLVLVILSTIMLPQLGNFNRLARFVVVSEDVGAICATLKKFLDEVMLPGPYSEPGGSGTPNITTANRTGLLVGPGGVPEIVSGDLTYNMSTPASNVWGLGIGTLPGSPQTFDMKTDKSSSASTLTFDVDLLENHLQVNAPKGLGTTPAQRYKNVIDDPTVGAFFGWRGPYFNEINSDPWGTRYSVNTFGLHGGGGGADDIYMTAVICISFGPNKQANTGANMPGNGVSGGTLEDYLIGGDDIAAVLSAAGPF